MCVVMDSGRPWCVLWWMVDDLCLVKNNWIYGRAGFRINEWLIHWCFTACPHSLKKINQSSFFHESRARHVIRAVDNQHIYITTKRQYNSIQQRVIHSRSKNNDNAKMLVCFHSLSQSLTNQPVMQCTQSNNKQYMHTFLVVRSPVSQSVTSQARVFYSFSLLLFKTFLFY